MVFYALCAQQNSDRKRTWNMISAGFEEISCSRLLFIFEIYLPFLIGKPTKLFSVVERSGLCLPFWTVGYCFRSSACYLHFFGKKEGSCFVLQIKKGYNTVSNLQGSDRSASFSFCIYIQNNFPNYIFIYYHFLLAVFRCLNLSFFFLPIASYCVILFYCLSRYFDVKCCFLFWCGEPSCLKGLVVPLQETGIRISKIVRLCFPFHFTYWYS